MNIIERIAAYLAECEAASCREMEPDPEPLLLACRDEIIAARACAEMMLQGTGQKIGEECARRVMEQHYLPKWMSVDERLPEIGVSVLCSSKEPPGEDWVWIGQREEYEWYFPGANEMGTPTHWMPLPEPPEVK